ncbi:MAG: hypothetical protein GX270_06725 [Clostridiaceae bacterium]|jgi:hypothetical protein|nr:hypothetical protein [Clostridiaceae bacterium]
MQTNNSKKIASDKIEQIFEEFKKINKFSKSLIIHGTNTSLILLSFGMLTLIFNQTILEYESYTHFVGTTLVKNSIVLLAEFIIGGLAIDYFTKK